MDDEELVGRILQPELSEGDTLAEITRKGLALLEERDKQRDSMIKKLGVASANDRVANLITNPAYSARGSSSDTTSSNPSAKPAQECAKVPEVQAMALEEVAKNWELCARIENVCEAGLDRKLLELAKRLREKAEKERVK